MDIELSYIDLAAAIVNRARDDYFEARRILEREEVSFDPPEPTGVEITEATKAIVIAIATTEASEKVSRGDMRNALGVWHWRNLTEDQGRWFCDKNNREKLIKKAADLRARRKAEETIKEVKEFLCSTWFDTLTLSVCDPAKLWQNWKKTYEKTRHHV